MFQAFIGLGSNVGPRKNNIESALSHLSEEKGLLLQQVASLYETKPVGGPSQRDFLNTVAELHTALTPSKLMMILIGIERQMGRKREIKWGPRLIDLDLLTFDRKIIKERGLILPHPYYHLRRFVLVPFCELNPHYVHPVLKRQNRSLLRQLTAPDQRVTMWAKWKKSPSYQFKRKRSLRTS